MKPESGERTLLASVVMSSPGPIVVGMALIYGRSSTQLADFIRRSAELVAIIVSWIVFRTLQREELEAELRERLERIANTFVGVAMCLSSLAILFVALCSPGTGQGNVIPGLVIAILGVTTNTWFWLRYRGLHRVRPNAILAVQSRLYRAKALVDACVTAALTVVAIAPTAPMTRYIDLVGSVVVGAYLIVNGINTLTGRSLGDEPERALRS